MLRPILATLAIAIATRAIAQDDAFMSAFNSSQQIQSNYLSSVMGSAAVGGAAANANAASRRVTNGTARASARPAPAMADRAEALRLPYRASPVITTKLKREMADTLTKQSPQQAAAIQRFVDSGNFVTEFDKDMQSYGYALRSGDVVDAFAAYWLCMWSIANNAQQPGASEALAVRKQVATSMASNPTLERADDATRQLVAEGLITEAELALSLRDYATHNGRNTQPLADSTYRNLLAKGIDLRAMQVTRDGFVRR
jgi:uncharacterized protein DUF6683